MANATPCPDLRDLERFLLAQLAEGEAGPLEQHLLECELCCQKARTLNAEDPLIAALKQGPPPDLNNDHGVLETFIGSLKRLHTPEVTFPPATGDEDTIEDLYSFLAPPLAADEMGRLGGYRILTPLGRGGMGLVFHAEDPQLRRAVAIKVMRPNSAGKPSARQRFLREAQAIAALNHDHIISILHVGEERGILFLVMPLLQGETLQDRLSRGPILPTDQIVSTGRQIAEGLAAAHERGLIHHDIKPSNIWLEARGARSAEREAPDQNTLRSALCAPLTPRVKIFDFGLARTADDDNPARAGVLMGTLEYMAPEQADGNFLDPRSDLYSLGCVLYCLCTGQVPFPRTGTAALLRALASEAPPPVRDLNASVPPALADLIMRLLAKDPAHRPASARAAALALDALAGASAPARSEPDVPQALPQAVLPSAPKPSRRWRRFRHGASVAGVAALVLLLCWAGQRLFSTRDDHPGLAPAESYSQVLPDRPSPFALLPAGGGQPQAFSSLEETLAVLQDGDTIEVHGNGPFTVGSVRLIGKALILRAAPGYRPQFVVKKWLGGQPIRLGPHQWGCSESIWLESKGGALQIEGCDFHGRPGIALFSSRGAACSLHNCRLLTDTRQWCYYSGPRLRITDCLIHAVIHVGPKAEIELRNNVGRAAIALETGGGQTVQLHRNTLISPGIGLLTLPDPKGLVIVTVEAEKSVFRNGTFLLIPDVRSSKALKERLRWLGKDNLYEAAVPAISDNLGRSLAQGLTHWNQFWGREENGSRQADHVFWQWDAPRRHSLDSAFQLLHSATERLRKALPGSADFGPNWNLVGPGEPYVRALAARRRSGDGPAADELRPKPLPGGPFVIHGRGQTIRGHHTLQRAVATAASGEIIEIRGDGPFLGFLRQDAKDGKDIVVRAAPGYLPVIGGDVVLSPQDTFSAEGIRLHGRIWAPGQARIGRLTNCALDGPPNLATLGPFFEPGVRGPAEITNCLIRPMFRLGLPAGNKLLVRNSVLVDAVPLLLAEKGQRALEIEDCLLWHPMPYRCIIDAIGEGHADILCRRTVFEAGGALLNGKRIGRWTGVGNVYCCGLRTWSDDTYLMGLDAWKERWHSSEEGSVEAEPLDYDPAQWRLLPSSAGYHAAPGAKDFGADTDRVARTPESKTR